MSGAVWLRVVQVALFCSLLSASSFADAGGRGATPPEAATAGASIQEALSAQMPAYVPGEIIVRYKPAGLAAQSTGLSSRLGLKTKRRLALKRAELLQAPAGSSVEQVISELMAGGQVEWAQPNYVYRPMAVVPADPLWPYQWGHDHASDTDIDLPEGWAYRTSDREMIVAVIDTGADISHPDLAGRLWINPGEVPGNGLDDDANGYADDIHGWDFKNNDASVFDDPAGDLHGTHVAGILAAASDATGIAGVAPKARVMVLKFIGGGTGSTADALEAIAYAQRMGARIANTSWGGGAYDQALREAMRESGMLIVAAAGNDGMDNDYVPVYPASYDEPNILAVAAIDYDGELASFSNYGAQSVDLAAPGVFTLSTVPAALPAATVPAGVYRETGPYRALTLGFGLESLKPESMVDLLDRAMDAIGIAPGPATRILLVNDGTVDDDSGYNPLYRAALEAVGFTAASGTVTDTVNVGADTADGPDLTTLQQYSAVIWYTDVAYGGENVAGQWVTTLTEADQANLAAYLSGGGRLLLTGEDALYLIEGSTLVNTTLGISHQGEQGGYQRLVGEAGTALADGVFRLAAPGSVFVDVLAASPNSAGARTALAFGYGTGYGLLSGTSMAAPHVSGIAAAVLAQKNLTAEEAIALIRAAGKPLPSLAGRTVTGKVPSLDLALGTRVQAPVVRLGDPRPSVSSEYRIYFSTSPYGTLASGAQRSDTVTLTFPEGTSLPSALDPALIVFDLDGSLLPADRAVVSGRSVFLAVPAYVGSSTMLGVRIDARTGIVNPSAVGEYRVSVSTSADPAAAESAAYLVTNGVLAFDRSAYHGLGAEDVAWDDWAGQREFRADRVLLRLTGSEQNRSPAVAEQVIATVWTEGADAGITMALTETGPDTNLFEGSFGFTAGPSDGSSGRVRVADGAVLAAEAAGVRTTATWRAAKSQGEEYLLHGLAFFDPALVADTSVEVTAVSAHGFEMSGWVHGGAGFQPGSARYLAVLPVGTDAHSLIAAAPGFEGRGSVLLSGTAGLSVITFQAGSAWVDAYGHEGPVLALAPDALPPAAPSVGGPAPGSASPQGTVHVYGTVEAFTRVEARLNGAPLSPVRATAAGDFSLWLTSLPDGSNTVELNSVDPAANRSATAVLTFQVDTVPPAPPRVGRVTSDHSYVTGAAEPGTTVTAVIGQAPAGSAVTGPDGTFGISAGMLPVGATLSVVAVDRAGHSSAPARVQVEPSDDARLSSLSVSPAGLTLIPVPRHYTLEVPHRVESITVSAIPSSGQAYVLLNGTAGTAFTVPLRTGVNTLVLQVHAESGSLRAYTLTVLRAPPTGIPAPPPALSAPPPGGRSPAALTGSLTLRIGGTTRGAEPATSAGITAAVTVPWSLLESLVREERLLVIEAPQATLYVPPAALLSAAAVQGRGGAGAAIRLALSSRPPGESQTAGLQRAGLRTAGPVLKLEASILPVAPGSAAEIAIDRFAHAVTVAVPFRGEPSESALGVYRFHPKRGTWEKAGGHAGAEPGTVEAEIVAPGAYAVMKAQPEEFHRLPAPGQ